jgi:hypothetical protein
MPFESNYWIRIYQVLHTIKSYSELVSFALCPGQSAARGAMTAESGSSKYASIALCMCKKSTSAFSNVSACDLEGRKFILNFGKGPQGGKGDPAGGGRGEGIQSLLALQYISRFTTIPRWDPHFGRWDP